MSILVRDSHASMDKPSIEGMELEPQKVQDWSSKCLKRKYVSQLQRVSAEAEKKDVEKDQQILSSFTYLALAEVRFRYLIRCWMDGQPGALLVFLKGLPCNIAKDLAYLSPRALNMK